MNAKWVLLGVVGLLSLLPASGLAYAQGVGGKSAVATVGTLQVEVIAAEGGLVEGENTIAVQLTDSATGKPLVQDAVRVEMTMDTGDRSMNHGDMTTQKPVLAELAASKDVAGRYAGKVNLSGVGKWNAKVYVDAQRSTILDVSVAAASGPNWLSIAAGVAAVVVVGFVGAVVFRRRNAAPAVASKAAGRV